MRIHLTSLAFLASLAARAAAPDYGAAAADARQLIAELVATDTTNPPGNEARAAASAIVKRCQGAHWTRPLIFRSATMSC